MIAVLVPWIACLSLTGSSFVELDPDPVTGVWKGTLTGKGEFFPESGVPASFWLTLDDERVTGAMAFQGFEVAQLEGAFDEAENRWSIAGQARGAPVTAHLAVTGDELEGEVVGLGQSFPVHARRIAASVLPEPISPAAPVNLATLTEQAWLDDLRFLAQYLPQVHAHAFHSTSQDDWNDAVTALVTRLPELDGTAKAIALAQLVARVGDAHTELHWRELPGFAGVPVRFEAFADGVFVTAVDARWESVLGAEVLEIGRRSARRALDAVATVFAAENDSWRVEKGLGNLAIPGLLSALDVSSLGSAVPLIVETRAGEELEVLIESVGSTTWRQLPDPGSDATPRVRRRQNERYWSEPMTSVETGGAAALYWAYNSCAEDPERPMQAFLDDLLKTFDDAGAERLILDLRNNSGGNSAVLSQHLPLLFERCGAEAIAVLIGPTTYSSGMMNAHQLRERGATLFGTPTGGKPNSYGELRSFRLPASGLRVFYSTKYFRMLEDDPPAVEPDVLVEPRAADVFAGRDPVLEAALAHD